MARDNQRPVVIRRRVQRDQALLRLRQLLDLPAGTTLDLVTRLGDTSAVVLPPFAATLIGPESVLVPERLRTAGKPVPCRP